LFILKILFYFVLQDGESTERVKTVSVLLEPRSLVVVKGEMYSDHLHAIEEATADVIDETVRNRGDRPIGAILDRTTRVSLTIRHVPKTTKARIVIGR